MRGDRRSRILFCLALMGLALLLASCAEDAPADFLNDPGGPYAEEADKLWDIVFPIAVGIFVIVEGLLVFAIIKFRARPGREAAQFHGNTKVEVALTAIPALILAGIAVPTVQTIFDLAREPSNALRVKVTAHQFWWEFEYTDLGIVTANEMYVPVDQPVRAEVTGGATDRVDGTAEVIHSFWPARLAGKQDVIPGRSNLINFEASEEDRYIGLCTEFCGLSHANMRFVVVAVGESDFDQWVEDLKAPAPEDVSVAEGRELFEQGAENMAQPCSNCHVVDATDIERSEALGGPNLDGFANRERFAAETFANNDEELAAWLRGPADVKPGAKMPDLDLTQEQIDALIAYLRTLE
jgi:cytochrome c oxidase subunit II